jgi:hypothetical protein
MTAGIASIVAGVSSLTSLLALLGYWYYTWQIQNTATSVRQIIEGDRQFDAQAVISILAQFETDQARLRALEALTHASASAASALLQKVKANVDLRQFNRDGWAFKRRQSGWVAFFFALAVVSVAYNLYGAVPGSG